ncbi:MAG: AsmA-like C-terminal region-containing protein, partial [Planctomycetota bacterium]|nr:AsmA-like C-terminal region-containing protein [Planctomycetota bacterium]
TTTAEVTDLAGMGLSGELSARLRAGPDGSALDNVEGQINLDLQAARSWLGALAGLDPQARLAGVARSRVRLAGEDAGQRLDASVQITNLAYQSAPGAARLQEPRVNVRANAWLAPEGGRHRADELKITAAAITIDGSGSTYVASPDTDMDLAIQLAGDAAKLAPTLAALLGEGYEDLRGEGRLSGRFRATGSADDDAASLLVDGNAVLGSWSTRGLEVGDLKATLARTSAEEPLSLGLTSKLNKGRLFSQGAMTLGTPQYPWKGQLDLSDVDTSGVVTSQGFGRLLAFALPALLPAGANVPVLSGLLTARIEAEAPSLEDPAMLDGLTGRGRVSMTQGSIKNSTLFGGGSGGGQLGKIIQGLKLAVPEAGRVLESATKALTFSSLESKFRIAQRVVHVDRAKLSGTSLDVDLQGTVQFDKRVALASKLVLLGSAGKKVAKVLPGGAIPLRIGGTLASPQVRPDVDMGKLLAGAVGDPGDLLDRLKKKGLPKIKNPFK